MKKFLKGFLVILGGFLLIVILSGEENRNILTNKVHGVFNSRINYDIPPKMKTTSIIYPETARAFNLSGRLFIEMLVDTLGHTNSINVVKTSGWTVLDSAAIESAKNWTFEPALYNNKPVEARFSIGVVMQPN